MPKKSQRGKLALKVLENLEQLFKKGHVQVTGFDRQELRDAIAELKGKQA